MIYCLEVLVLTPELSDAGSWDLGKEQEYYGPVKPQQPFGRPAKLPLHRPVEHAVWYGWRDIGVSKITMGAFCTGQ